jgi:hypothetical protein
MPLFLQLILLLTISAILAPLVLRSVTFLLRKLNFLDRPHLYKYEK